MEKSDGKNVLTPAVSLVIFGLGNVEAPGSESAVVALFVSLSVFLIRSSIHLLSINSKNTNQNK